MSDQRPIELGPPLEGPAAYTGPVEVVDCPGCEGWGRNDFGPCERCERTGRIARPRPLQARGTPGIEPHAPCSQETSRIRRRDPGAGDGEDREATRTDPDSQGGPGRDSVGHGARGRALLIGDEPADPISEIRSAREAAHGCDGLGDPPEPLPEWDRNTRILVAGVIAGAVALLITAVAATHGADRQNPEPPAKPAASASGAGPLTLDSRLHRPFSSSAPFSGALPRRRGFSTTCFAAVAGPGAGDASGFPEERRRIDGSSAGRGRGIGRDRRFLCLTDAGGVNDKPNRGSPMSDKRYVLEVHRAAWVGPPPSGLFQVPQRGWVPVARAEAPERLHGRRERVTALRTKQGWPYGRKHTRVRAEAA